MASRFRRALKWIGYPICYLLLLGLFLYINFPFDRVGERIVAEFDRASAKDARRSGGQPMRLSLGEIDGYWFSGVEVRNVELTIPPKPKRKKRFGAPDESKGDKAAEPMKLRVDEATARVRILPLLIGRLRIEFAVKAFGGSIEGVVPYGKGSGDVDVEIDGLRLSDVGPLKSMLAGIPLLGQVSGNLKLEPKGGKFSKANGELNLEIDKVVFGNGKAKVQGVALPAAQIGKITFTAKASNGLLEIEEFSSEGRDFELAGDGKVKLNESWKRSVADVHVRFKFTDAYRDKDDATRGLLGKPGAKYPALIELDPRGPFKRAKRDDGMYGFYIHGPLSRIDADPQPERPKSRSRRGRKGRSSKARLPFKKARRAGSKARRPSARPSRRDEERDRPSGGVVAPKRPTDASGKDGSGDE